MSAHHRAGGYLGSHSGRFSPADPGTGFCPNPTIPTQKRQRNALRSYGKQRYCKLLLHSDVPIPLDHDWFRAANLPYLPQHVQEYQGEHDVRGNPATAHSRFILPSEGAESFSSATRPAAEQAGDTAAAHITTDAAKAAELHSERCPSGCSISMRQASVLSKGHGRCYLTQ